MDEQDFGIETFSSPATSYTALTCCQYTRKTKINPVSGEMLCIKLPQRSVGSSISGRNESRGEILISSASTDRNRTPARLVS